MSGKKFQFSLESILKLRRHEAEGARRDLLKIVREVKSQSDVVDDARIYLYRIVSSRSNGVTGQRSLSRYESFRQDAQHRFDTAKRKLQHLRDMEVDARIRFIECKGAEDAVERLREQEEEQYWKNHKAAERQLLDEQAISNFQRQKRAVNS